MPWKQRIFPFCFAYYVFLVPRTLLDSSTFLNSRFTKVKYLITFEITYMISEFSQCGPLSITRNSLINLGWKGVECIFMHWHRSSEVILDRTAAVKKEKSN